MNNYIDARKIALLSVVRPQIYLFLFSECIRLLGRDDFNKAYDYLNRVRFDSASVLTEVSIMDGLRNLVAKPTDCFLVDQLLFLEKQEEIQNEST